MLQCFSRFSEFAEFTEFSEKSARLKEKFSRCLWIALKVSKLQGTPFDCQLAVTHIAMATQQVVYNSLRDVRVK